MSAVVYRCPTTKRSPRRGLLCGRERRPRTASCWRTWSQWTEIRQPEVRGQL